jgi:N-acetylglucosamine malate deacetylase 1
MKIKRVLAIGAHPNDTSIVCGGTLAKYTKLGAKVSICTVTDGSAWSEKIPQEKLIEIRKKEFAAAAKILKAEGYWCGLPDALLFNDEEIIRELLDVIRAAKPDVIITHNTEDDYCSDNRATGRSAFKAALISSLANVKSRFPALPATPVVYSMENWINRKFVPLEYVDTAEVFPVKVRLVKAHRSPMELLKKYDKMDIVEFVEQNSRMRGYQSGVKYAEGFRLATNFPVVKPYRLLP